MSSRLPPSTGSQEDMGGAGLLRRFSNNSVRHLTVSLALILVVIGLFQFEWDGLKGLLVDLLYRSQWWSEARDDLVIVGYDQKSSIRYSGSSKLPVQELVKLLRVLRESDAKAIGIFAPINEKTYNIDELTSLGNALSQLNNVVIGYTDDESLGRPAPEPLRDTARYLPGMVSRDNFSYGADGVTRRVMIAIDGFPTAYAEIARQVFDRPVTKPFQNEQSYMTTLSRQTFIHWEGRPPAYPMFASREFVEREIDPKRLKGKIVLIGNAFPSQNARDFILTPYSRSPWQTYYLEGVAQSVATLLNDNGLVKTPFLASLAFCLILGLVTVNLVLILSPMRGIALVLTQLLGVFAFAWLLLFLGNTWLDLAHPFLTVGVGYYLVIPYRLLSEYRTRWHYQEKSELMAQLEQLKSNFLSLVSHDLKTPIARIQGSAELLLKASQIEEKERRSLAGIIKTTEELSEYVQTLLDLTRIESAKIPLQKVSKDINMTLRDIAESKRPQAAEKNIEIVTELEPIFSFRFDPKLIHRVVSNLVENAIKYSPENTTIHLGSKEDGGWIRVTVTDEGFGIPEQEQTKVFEKFYRGESARADPTKGSGLGLYLVKYFVELHKGVVELKSEIGKGTVFTISLPV